MIPFLDVGAAYAEMKESLDRAFFEVMNSRSYIRGGNCEEFEAAFAQYSRNAYCIGVGNGLDALTLLLRSVDIGAGDEVLVPSHTFIATWLSVKAVGAIPIPVEPDPELCVITAADLENKLTPRSKAIVPVHLYGQMADVRAIVELAKTRDLFVFEDAAQCHGAAFRGFRPGQLSHGAAWSFYPGKNLGAFGDGGAITTQHENIARRARTLSNYGSAEKYVHSEIGTNSRLDELQAAFLRVKLEKLDEWNARRSRVADRYLSEIRNPKVKLPAVGEGADHVWHLFVIQVDERAHLQRYLQEAEIGTMIHYPVAPHMSGAFGAGFHPEAFPLARTLAARVLSLPMGPHLKDVDVTRVIEKINRWA